MTSGLDSRGSHFLPMVMFWVQYVPAAVPVCSKWVATARRLRVGCLCHRRWGWRADSKGRARSVADTTRGTAVDDAHVTALTEAADAQRQATAMTPGTIMHGKGVHEKHGCHTNASTLHTLVRFSCMYHP